MVRTCRVWPEFRTAYTIHPSTRPRGEARRCALAAQKARRRTRGATHPHATTANDRSYSPTPCIASCFKIASLTANASRFSSDPDSQAQPHCLCCTRLRDLAQLPAYTMQIAPPPEKKSSIHTAPTSTQTRHPIQLIPLRMCGNLRSCERQPISALASRARPNALRSLAESHAPAPSSSAQIAVHPP